jgi:hypothetical protein
VLVPEPLKDLLTLTADELVLRLTEHVRDCAGLILGSELEIARECIRRARRAEAAERAVQELAARLQRLG